LERSRRVLKHPRRRERVEDAASQLRGALVLFGEDQDLDDVPPGQRGIDRESRGEHVFSDSLQRLHRPIDETVVGSNPDVLRVAASAVAQSDPRPDKRRPHDGRRRVTRSSRVSAQFKAGKDLADDGSETSQE
jgi:hypothetical protein